MERPINNPDGSIFESSLALRMRGVVGFRVHWEDRILVFDVSNLRGVIFEPEQRALVLCWRDSFGEPTYFKFPLDPNSIQLQTNILAPTAIAVERMLKTLR